MRLESDRKHAGQTGLARRADIAIVIDHIEDTQTQLPMVSRILHLLVVDILAVGLALRKGAQADGGAQSDAPTLALVTSRG
jgi:glucokinase